MAKRDRKHKPALNDWHLWTEVTRSVSPLRKPAPATPPAEEKPVAQTPEPRSDRLSHRSPGTNPVRRRSESGPGYSVNPATKVRPTADIEPRLRRKLMRGHLPIDATIDLHGLRQAEAHAALCRFIAARHARGDRTVLVITGKGLKKSEPGTIEQRGVLRTMLPHWLSEPALAPLVSGWQVSAQGHGGEGAYYVRLRRPGR